jgi:hypothetical protein
MSSQRPTIETTETLTLEELEMRQLQADLQTAIEEVERHREELERIQRRMARLAEQIASRR